MARLADLRFCDPASTSDVRGAGEGMSTGGVDDGIFEDFGEAGGGPPCPASPLAETPCSETRSALGGRARTTGTLSLIHI